MLCINMPQVNNCRETILVSPLSGAGKTGHYKRGLSSCCDVLGRLSTGASTTRFKMEQEENRKVNKPKENKQEHAQGTSIGAITSLTGWLP